MYNISNVMCYNQEYDIRNSFHMYIFFVFRLCKYMFKGAFI